MANTIKNTTTFSFEIDKKIFNFNIEANSTVEATEILKKDLQAIVGLLEAGAIVTPK